MAGGQGTPWGPMEYGKPKDISLIEDPNSVKGFDYSDVKRQLMEELAQQGGQAERQYLASSSKALGSGTNAGSRLGRLQGIAADTQRNQMRAATDIAMREWEDKKSIMDAINRARQAKYQIDAANYGNEQAGRGQAIGSLLSGGATIGGSYLGGK